MVAFDVTPWSALAVGIVLEDLVDELVARPAWHRDALCQEYPVRAFFPLQSESAEPAREVCRRCAVRPECLAWAMAVGADLHGVWGGTSKRQRRAARDAGLDLEEILRAVDTRTPRDDSPSTWQTDPCRGCAGNLSRRDVAIGDGWCWACRPTTGMEPAPTRTATTGDGPLAHAGSDASMRLPR